MGSDENKPRRTRKPAKNKVDDNNELIDSIKEIITAEALKKQHIKRKTKNELEAMVSTCEEFMNSFIILGYDFNGDAVDPIIVAHNQQEADSLGAYLNKFIMSQQM